MRGATNMFFFALTLVLCRGFTPPPARRCGVTRKEALVPVFDPLNDELEFPLPYAEDATTYIFTRAVHLRMIEAALRDPEPRFFHAVGGRQEGAVGVVARVLATKEDDRLETEDPDVKALRVAVVCDHRARIDSLHSSIPFDTANVTAMTDGDDDDDGREKQREAFEALRQVANLSRTIERKGPAADEAELLLEALDAKITAHQDRDLATVKETTPGQRRERAGFFLLSCVSPPYDCLKECLATTNSTHRFELLLSYLRPLRADLGARAALSELDIPAVEDRLQPGDRVAYWWSEADGWFQGTVLPEAPKAPPPPDGFYPIRFDVDGEICLLQLDRSTKVRWRLLGYDDDR